MWLTQKIVTFVLATKSPQMRITTQMNVMFLFSMESFFSSETIIINGIKNYMYIQF